MKKTILSLMAISAISTTALAQVSSVGYFKTTASMTVDGAMNEPYSANSLIVEDVSGTIDGAADLSVTLTATWTAEGLYLFTRVFDNIAVASGDEIMPDVADSIELFIWTGGSSGSSEEGMHDAHITISLDGEGDTLNSVELSSAISGDADFSELAVAAVVGTPMSAYEIFIPWEGAGELIRNHQIGFAIRVNDDDGSGHEGALQWSGNVLLWESRTIEISPTTATLIIDGELDAAYAAAYVTHSDGRWLDAPPYPSDTYFTWYSLYDEENLYLYMYVQDSVIISGDTPGTAWLDDSVEMYFDGNNNKGGAFDGNNDVKIFIVPSPGSVDPIVSTNGFPPPPPGTNFSGLEVAQKITDSGWSIEMKMPLSIIKVNPQPNGVFGIDFLVNDDDVGEGTGRDGILSWSSGAALNNRTDLFGTAIFAAQPQPLTLSVLIGASLVTPVLSLYDSDLGMFVESAEQYGSWVYHVDLGWLYKGALSLEGEWLWFYSTEMEDWVATSAGLYPIIAVGGEMWFYVDGEYRYNYEEEMWITF